MIPRSAAAELLAALEDSPVVFLHGARQTGKTTLARLVANDLRPARYLTLDDLGVLSLIRADPQGFVRGLEGPVVLDEIQRCPEAFLPLKAAVDEDRAPGRFLLTGSASVLVLPELADALVGRMEILRLRGLAQAEIEETSGSFVDVLFSDEPLPTVESEDEGLWGRVLAGGFPEAVRRKDRTRRRAWLESYVQTVLQRDVIDLARVEGLTRLPDLLRLLAARGGSLLNVAELSRSAQLPRTTLDRYLALLEGTFLIRRLPAWSPNLGKRLVRSPKVFIEDPGLAAHLLGLERVDEMSPASVRGPLLESFVRAEVEALASWSRTRPRVHHFRSHTGIEVDLVLEDARGRCVAIETKATATVGPRDFKGLRWLAEHLGDRFVRGVLLYTGRTTVPAGERSAALPVEALWRVASE